MRSFAYSERNMQMSVVISRAHRSSISAIVSLVSVYLFLLRVTKLFTPSIPANECENEGIVIVFDMNYSQFRPFSFSVCLSMRFVYFNPQSFGMILFIVTVLVRFHKKSNAHSFQITLKCVIHIVYACGCFLSHITEHNAIAWTYQAIYTTIKWKVQQNYGSNGSGGAGGTIHDIRRPGIECNSIIFMLDKQKQMPTFCLKYVSKMKVRKVKRHRLCCECGRYTQVLQYVLLLLLPPPPTIPPLSRLMQTMCIIYLLLSLRLISKCECTQNVTIIASLIVDRCRASSCGFSVSVSFVVSSSCCARCVCVLLHDHNKLNAMIAKKHEPTVNKTERWTSSFACKLIKHLCLFALPDKIL